MASADSLDRTGTHRRLRRVRRAGGRRYGPPDAGAGAAEPVEGARRLERHGWRAEHLHAARHGHRRHPGRLALRSRRPRPRHLVGGLHLHASARAVIAFSRAVLADRGDAVHLRLRHRGALQHRHAARRRVRADAHPHHGARHAAGGLVGRLRDRGAARPSYILPRYGWRPLFFVRDPPWHPRAAAAVGPAGSAELVAPRISLERGAARAERIRQHLGGSRAAPHVHALDADVDRAAVRLLRRELLAAELSGQGSRRQPAEHGLVRRRHLHDDGVRQGHHRLPRRHRRTAARCGSSRAC